ncbi:hypothetical protein DVH02_31355 [Streptomyces corynorhini]|uniref:Uncharacterized protein n=1 Tax=Streptomyces corynorhini TaxID=2282652 RepID=A0A370AVV7_9ACTN|nr:hypothetical protein DVH02_31355 [Streptomyces corynorhini]
MTVTPSSAPRRVVAFLEDHAGNTARTVLREHGSPSPSGPSGIFNMNTMTGLWGSRSFLLSIGAAARRSADEIEESTA